MLQFSLQSRIVNICFNPAMDIHIYIDTVELGKEKRSENIFSRLGGKGLNLARYFSALSQRTNHFIALPSSHREMIIEQCQTYNGKISFLETEAPLRQNYTIHEREGRETRLIDDRYVWTEEEFLCHCENILSGVNKNDIVIISGRLPKGIKEDAVMSFVDELKKKEVDLVVDSKSFSLKMLRRTKPILIKPNLEEALSLLNSDRFFPLQVEFMDEDKKLSILPDLAKSLYSLGLAKHILLSCSENGLIYCDSEELVWVKVPDIVVKSTIGAGDLSLAVFLVSVLQNSDKDKFPEIVKRAAATATAYCVENSYSLPSMERITEILQSCELLHELFV